MKKSAHWLLIAAMAAAISGCSSFKHRNQITDFNAAYIAGDYQTAAEAMQISPPLTGQTSSENNLLELLHQAEAQRLQGNWQASIDLYDQAEDGMKMLDTANLAEKSLENGLAILVNDAELDYQPMLCEAVLVNTYKGLSFLQMGNDEYARIEFNRADDRTRRAVSAFAEEIAEQQQALEADGKSSTERVAIQQSLANQALQQSVSRHYGETSQWSVYPEFIVPAATYLHGLYFLASGKQGDIDRAVTSLGRVAEMTPGNKALAADAELAEALARGQASRQSLGPRVWVVYENGLGPVAEETRFDVPLLLFHGNDQAPAYTGIALPRYADRQAVTDTLTLTDGEDLYEPEAFADMGKVVRTEMQSRFPAVLSRAVASAVVKALMQNEATEQLGVAGQLGSAMLTALTTQADLRSWQATPNHWQVARLRRPDSGTLTLQGQTGVLGSLALPEWPYTLVYIKRPSQQGPAEVSIIDLQGAHPGEQHRLGDDDSRLMATAS